MGYFETPEAARAWAESYGMPYPFKIDYVDAETSPWVHPALVGLYRVTFDDRWPEDC